MLKTIDDTREIMSLTTRSHNWNVGFNNISAIVPYEENGQMAPITWFAIYFNGVLLERVMPGEGVVVEYCKDEPS